MATFDEAPILDLGKSPIPGPAPCGKDAADDEDYILATSEIAKLDRIESGEPEWHSLERITQAILKDKSKDVEIASALGFALFKQKGYAGLAAWMGLTTELVKNFWDDLFPGRPRRRKARIETVTDRFGDGGWFRENQPKPDDFDALDLCAERIKELEAELTGKMPDDPPDFKKFVRGLKELCDRRPKPAAAPPPVAEGAPADAGGPSADSGAPTGAGAAPAFQGGEVSDKGGASRAVLEAATFLRKADAADPMPYALTRAVKWARIELPKSAAGKFEIEPPEAALVDRLEHQFGNQVWENLLKNAEGAFRSSDPLWLDLQRYVCCACQGLGAPYDKVREAVQTATAGLIQRLGDGLFELKFRGGRPLCSGETRMWIDSEVATAEGGGGGGGMGDGVLKEATATARKLAGAGKLKEALIGLQEGLASCTQRRERFQWQLRIAQVCLDAQKWGVAGPLLEACYEEIQAHGIDKWESSLAVEVAQGLYRCRKALASAQKQPSAESLEKVRESFTWLCQLDPVVALATEPSGS